MQLSSTVKAFFFFFCISGFPFLYVHYAKDYIFKVENKDMRVDFLQISEKNQYHADFPVYTQHHNALEKSLPLLSLVAFQKSQRHVLESCEDTELHYIHVPRETSSQFLLCSSNTFVRTNNLVAKEMCQRKPACRSPSLYPSGRSFLLSGDNCHRGCAPCGDKGL